MMGYKTALAVLWFAAFTIGNRQRRRHQAIEQTFLIGSSATDTQKARAVLLGDFCRYFPQKGRAQTDDGQI